MCVGSSEKNASSKKCGLTHYHPSGMINVSKVIINEMRWLFGKYDKLLNTKSAYPLQNCKVHSIICKNVIILSVLLCIIIYTL